MLQQAVAGSLLLVCHHLVSVGTPCCTCCHVLDTVPCTAYTRLLCIVKHVVHMRAIRYTVCCGGEKADRLAQGIDYLQRLRQVTGHVRTGRPKRFLMPVTNS